MNILILDSTFQQNEKISCQGTIILPLGTNIPFEIRSGIRTSCRGHVLEFPGLEISISHVLVPVLPEVAVYLGENFRFLDVSVDGSNRLVQFSAKAKIIPHPGVRGLTSFPSNLFISEKDGRRRESYSAIFNCDAADWITTICQFR